MNTKTSQKEKSFKLIWEFVCRLKDSEEDASQAERYLDKKRDKQRQRMEDRTDVLKAMEAVEETSAR